MLTEMDEPGVADARRTIGSIKAAINKYGGKINFQVPPESTHKLPPKDMSNSQIKTPSKASELHAAKKMIDQLNQDTKMSDTEKSQAELRLLQAKKMVLELTSQIEECKSKTRDHVKVKSQDDDEHEQVTRQIEPLKLELIQLNLDMDRALEEKSRAEKEAEAAILTLEDYMNNAEQLQIEIEEANEEEVLVELAKIQAKKELAETQARMGEDRDKLSSQIEETRVKIRVLKEEVEKSRDLEERLDDTKADIQVLQNELSLIREMGRRVLDQRKKQLHEVEGRAFSVMRSIDDVRNELNQVLEEKEKLVKLEEETENSIKILNAKIVNAKEELESVSLSEQNERFMLSNLSIALENLRQEKQEVLKEKKSAEEETMKIRTQIQNTDNETDAMEEKLSVAMRELTAAKAAEAKALKKLKSMAEKVAKTRVSSSKKKPAIAISSFEYKYLAEGAVPAQEVAGKKIAAADAWTEALYASENEMKIEIKCMEEEVKELMVQEEQVFQRMEESLSTNQRKESKKSTRRSSVESKTTTGRRLGGRSSFTIKKRTMVNW